jgi:sugar phosphate isomerase/epimerase
VWANIIHPEPEQRARIHKLHADAIEYADRLGMEYILTHTGGRDTDDKDKPHPMNHSRQTWEMSVAATRKILADTAGSRVKLGFEAVNSCNMLHPGTIFRTTELLDQCFDLLGEDIMYCHAKDKVWNEMLPHFEGVTLGEGWLDYEIYLARMSRMARPRVLLIEHLPAEQYAPSLKHLKDTAAKLGVQIYS